MELETDAHEVGAGPRDHRAQVLDDDPTGGYALAYDAARKALTAILENQGLRPTTRGGHLAVVEAVRAQLDPPLTRPLRRFNRMRSRRNDAEYPPADAPEISAADVREDLAAAAEFIDIASRVLDDMSPFLRAGAGPGSREGCPSDSHRQLAACDGAIAAARQGML